MRTSWNGGEGGGDALEMPAAVARVAEHHVLARFAVKSLGIAAGAFLAVGAAPFVVVYALNDARVLEGEAGRMPRAAAVPARDELLRPAHAVPQIRPAAERAPVGGGVAWRRRRTPQRGFHRRIHFVPSPARSSGAKTKSKQTTFSPSHAPTPQPSGTSQLLHFSHDHPSLTRPRSTHFRVGRTSADR